MDDAHYNDDDLVYVDPRSRTVVGKVEWSNAGRPKPLPMEDPPPPAGLLPTSPTAESILPSTQKVHLYAEHSMPGQALNGSPPKDGTRRGAGEEDDDGKRHRRLKYYPWGTYRSMKRIYKIGDWKTTEDRRIPLDDAIEKSLKEPYWD